MKFKDPNFKHEIFRENRHEAFILLKLFHNLLAINLLLNCLLSAKN